MQMYVKIYNNKKIIKKKKFIKSTLKYNIMLD